MQALHQIQDADTGGDLSANRRQQVLHVRQLFETRLRVGDDAGAHLGERLTQRGDDEGVLRALLGILQQVLAKTLVLFWRGAAGARASQGQR